jgi:SAM-dependent methyltransferase
MSREANALLFRLISLQAENPGLGLLQFRNRLTAGQYRPLYELFLERFRKGERVLDWGGGNGHFSYFLAGQGFETHVFSLEEAPPVLRLLDQGSYVYIKGGKNDPISLPYPADYFDVVVSVGVLEHVRESGGDERASLGEIRRVLKPGGLFIAYHVPNEWSWIEFLSSFFPGKHHHRRRFTKRSLKNLIESGGFELSEIGNYGFLPRWLMSRCPARVGNSKAVAAVYNFIDSVLGAIMPRLSTNFLAIGRKPGGIPDPRP